mgnify:CR=1 FL=1
MIYIGSRNYKNFISAIFDRGIFILTTSKSHQDIAKATVTESETDAQIRNRILDEIDSGLRSYTQGSIDLAEYGEPEDALITDDDDDPGRDDGQHGDDHDDERGNDHDQDDDQYPVQD